MGVASRSVERVTYDCTGKARKHAYDEKCDEKYHEGRGGMRAVGGSRAASTGILDYVRRHQRTQVGATRVQEVAQAVRRGSARVREGGIVHLSASAAVHFSGTYLKP